MINGAHVIIYSTDAEKDRAFFRDVLSLGHVDVGGGWLIFGLPPSEVAMHPASGNDTHELYLMCDDIAAFIAQMQGRGIECTAVESLGCGMRTQIRLPGGGQLGVYEPRHERPHDKSVSAARAKRGTAKSKASRSARPRRAKSRPTKRKGKAARPRRS